MADEYRPLMLSYIEKGSGTLGFTDSEKQNIFILVRIMQYLYNYSGVYTGLDDYEYDKFYEVYINLGNEDIVSVQLPAGTRNTGEHKYPSLRGTLTKIYYLSTREKRTNPTRKYLTEWIQSTERLYKEKTGKKINLNDEEIYVFPKWDGVSCIFEFNPDGTLNKALTRGDTETNVAQDITRCFPKMKGRATDNGYGLKTEIMMREEDLDYFNSKHKTSYKNTRSVVSAILNSDDIDERNDLLVVQRLRDSTIHDGKETLQVLDDGVFNQPYIRCKLRDVSTIKAFAESVRFVDGLRCDGAVIYLINRELQEILGREKDKNKYEVAYKFTEEVCRAEVIDVIFQVGLFGELAPVARIVPVKLKGNAISKISLGSIKRFYSLDLHKGDFVKVSYDIIPYLIKDSSYVKGYGKKFKAPDRCPCCGELLERDEDDHPIRCINDNCDFRKKGAIINYLDKMRIDNISFATVDTFYEKGYLKDIYDLYTLKDKKNKLLKLDGFGKVSVNNILESIEKHNVVPEYVFLGAIGIPNIGTETFKLLLRNMTFPELMEYAKRNNIHKFTKISGIGKGKAEKICNGLNNKRDLIEKIISTKSVTLYHESITSAKFTLVCTKIDKETKVLVCKLVEIYGGSMIDKMKKGIDYLVVPSINTESKKTELAKSYGTKIIPYDDLAKFLKDTYGSKSERKE